MEIFDWEYKERCLLNEDGTASNFRQVFGMNGINVACPKSSYHIITTEDLSNLGKTFMYKGYNVSGFTHRNGEVIGINIDFGERPSKTGDCRYSLIITVPNNGGGKGYLSIKQTRLICSNGMVSTKTTHKDNYIKIPHTLNYREFIQLMEDSINSYLDLLEEVEQKDIRLYNKPMVESQVLYTVNKWFYEKELPYNKKTIVTKKDVNGNPLETKFLSLDDFRGMTILDRENLPCKNRYEELMEAFKKEIKYNEELGIDCSMYTAYATVTNYLSRRIEKSKSKAPEEVMYERSSKKLAYFD